jgi:hypothetical protein
MKHLLFLILLPGLINAVRAQVVPVISAKADTTGKKPQLSHPKGKSGGEGANTATVKFICDVDANLYIDGVQKGSFPEQVPFRVNLRKGEYAVKVVSSANAADGIEFNYTVSETGVEKLQKIELRPIITKRLNDEAAAADAKRKEDAVISFTENFSDNGNGWPLGSDAQKEMSIANGALLIKGIEENNPYFSDRMFNLNVNNDFNCEVIVKWVSGTNNHGFGMDFCLNYTTQNFYTFLISATGYYLISSWANGAWHSNVNWSTSDFLHKNNEPNVLLIRKQGDYINFFINDNRVETIPFAGYLGPVFGCRVEGNQSVEFEKFVLTGSKLR